MLITLPNAYGDAATNMAIDASLLYTLPAGIAAFRHYGWTEPAITFGYTQRLTDVRAAYPDDLRLCRRLTGGGIVDHRSDWTYALAIHTDLPAATIAATSLYHKIHTCIQGALKQQSIHSQLAPCTRKCGTTRTPPQGASQCFQQPTTNDVISESGAKIAGAAMKRTQEGLLIQGSVERSALPDNFDFHQFSTDFVQQISKALDLPIGTSEDLRNLFNSARIQQERTRFESDEWANKR